MTLISTFISQRGLSREELDNLSVSMYVDKASKVVNKSNSNDIDAVKNQDKDSNKK